MGRHRQSSDYCAFCASCSRHTGQAEVYEQFSRDHAQTHANDHGHEVTVCKYHRHHDPVAKVQPREPTRYPRLDF